MKRIIIIGAGPAGLGAAYRLAGEKNLEVTVIDRGKKSLERKCPSLEKCINCETCLKDSGIGGAGAFSDGKFTFETILGKRAVGSNLSEIIGPSLEKKYLLDAKAMYSYYGLSINPIDPKRLVKAEKVGKIAARNDMDYILTEQAHIGTDKLPAFINEIEKSLISKGIIFETSEEILYFDKNKVYSKKGEKEFRRDYDYLIVAPGRKGAIWLEEQMKRNKIAYGYRPIDFGVRVETDSKILEHLIEIGRDVKFEMMVPSHGTKIRTFCVCPNGKVMRETYHDGGFNLVNGASNSKDLSDNTNFALLMSIPLTNNANCNHYGDAIARVFKEIGVNHPVLQQLGDIKRDSRSRENKIYEWRIQPTLKDVHIGGIGWGMPYEIQKRLLVALDRLSAPGLMEGLNQDSTLLYAPEMKRNGLNVKTDEYCRTNNPKIRVAGDGAGKSRGITGASASGILAAEGILKDLY